MRSLGQHIRARRQSLGMTLEVLSQSVGYTKGYLSSIETGRRRRPPSAVLLGRLERALGLERGTLLGAGWRESAPDEVRASIRALEDRSDTAARLAALVLTEGGPGAAGWSAEVTALAERVREERGVPARPGTVPVLNDDGSGYPEDTAADGVWALARGSVTVPAVLGAGAYAVWVADDSMEPEYGRGDMVIVCPAAEIRGGMDGLVRLEGGGEPVFRRVYIETGEAGRETVRLQPLNSAYPPREVGRARVARLDEAVFVLRRAGGGRGAGPDGGRARWGRAGV